MRRGGGVDVQAEADGLHLVEEHALVAALVAPVKQRAVGSTVQRALFRRPLSACEESRVKFNKVNKKVSQHQKME